MIREEQLPAVFRAAVLQSPVSTWVADKTGTLVLQNAANRALFEVEGDERLVGEFSVFRDEEIVRQGLAPRIRKVFDEGGSTEFTLEYDFTQARKLTDARPPRRFLHVFAFAIQDRDFVVFQLQDVTERRNVDLALAQSQAQYRALVEYTSDWVWEVDLEGRYTFSNGLVKQLLGYEPEDVVGRSAFDFICPGDHERMRDVIGRAVDQGRGFEAVVHRMRRSDGSTRVIESSGRPILDAKGAILGFRGIDRDVTDRVEIERALKESEARLRTFVDNVPFDIWALDAENRYILQNPASEEHWGVVTGRKLEELDLPGEIKDQWLRNNARALAGETLHLEVSYTIDGEERTYRSAVAPIRKDEEIIGTLGLNLDITERKKAEQSLADAEAKYRGLVEKSLVGVYIIQEGKFSYVNPTLVELLGYDDASELEGRSVLDTVAPEDRDRVVENIRKRISGEKNTIRYSFTGIRKDGRRINVEVLGSRDTYQGRPAVIGSLLDITERVEAQKGLEASEAELRALISAMPDVILVLDDEGTYLKIPQTNPRLLYRPSDELLGKRLHDVFPEVEADRFLEAIRKAVEEKSTQHLEYILQIGGERFWFMASISPMDHQVIWIARDITEQKKAQEAEEHREKDLATIVDFMPGYAFLKEASGRYVTANQTFADAVGTTPREIAGKTDYDLFPKDLADKYRADDVKLIETGLPLLVGEEEMIQNGGRISVLTRKVPLTDERGKVVALIGLGFDITELKRAEEALRRSEENFRAIFNYAPALIVTYDRHAVVLEVNRAFERFSGYTRDQVVGRSMFETFARPEVLEQKEDVMAQVFEGETVQDSEWVAVRPDGSRVYALTNTTPVYDSTGKVAKALSMGVDITERKHAEQHERELEEHKRDFYRRTILAATEGKLVISEPDEIRRLAGDPIKTWEIESGEELGVIRQEVMDFAGDAGMDEARVYDLVLAVGELSTNALKHAGKGVASLHNPDGRLIFAVADRGPGIEAVTLPEVALVRGYSTAGTLGMGYKAVLSVTDRVFLATGPNGTTVAVEMSVRAVEPVAPGSHLPDTWMMQR